MKFTYLVIFVKDMDASLALYRDLLGFEVGFEYSEDDGTQVAFVVEPGKVPMKEAAMLELVTVPAGTDVRPAGYIIGLEVDSMAERAALLEANGYQLCEPYSPSPGYTNRDFKGPDGEEISLMEVDTAIAMFHKAN